MALFGAINYRILQYTDTENQISDSFVCIFNISSKNEVAIRVKDEDCRISIHPKLY